MSASKSQTTKPASAGTRDRLAYRDRGAPRKLAGVDSSRAGSHLSVGDASHHSLVLGARSLFRRKLIAPDGCNQVQRDQHGASDAQNADRPDVHNLVVDVDYVEHEAHRRNDARRKE